MKKKLDNYSLLDFNRDISEMVKDKNVNNLKMFVAAERKGKLSVTVRPDTSKEEVYHGLRPNFDEDFLRIFLRDLKSNKYEEFWDLTRSMQQKKKMMNLIFSDFSTEEEINEKYLLELIKNEPLKESLEINLLGKAILQTASHFGYEILVEDENLYINFENEMKEIMEDSNLICKMDKKLKNIKLLGIWPEESIISICNKFDVDIIENKLVLKANEQNKTKNNLYEMLSFRKDLNLKYFKLLTSDVYYSGVMPCVRKIEYEKNPSLSEKVKYIIFNVVRTTYATVDTMDNSKILEHSFFDGKSRKILTEFDYYEDILQNKYLYGNDDNELSFKNNQMKYEQHMIRNLNNYLKYSLNTHTVAVSTNLISEDGYLIAGKRGNRNIDAGEYYCSANGQTEFSDENVSFYRKSVFEDMPTMDYFSKYRVDLNKEIERECIAELGAASYGLEWNYYGVSFLSINNHIQNSKNISIEDSEKATSRRMHFNVLSSNTLSQSFKEVIKTHRTATESFENESIVGIKTGVFKNKIDLLKYIGYFTYSWLEENKSKIFLMLIFVSVLLGRKNYNSMDASNYFDIILLGVYFIMSIITWKNNQYIRRQQLVKYYYLPNYYKNNQIEMQRILQELSKKTSKDKFHGIFVIMYMLYFLSLIEED